MKDKTYNIPIEHREELIQLKPWMESLKLGLTPGDDRTRYLFDLYNEYLSTTNKIMEETCSSCRGKVYRRIMECIESFEQNFHGEY
jgi:hypothetical protein